MADRKLLADILLNSERDRIAGAWETAKPADDLKPLPAGEYRCRVVDGSLFSARSGTPGYKITLEVCEGEHVGRRLWHDVWLSEAAISLAKRDLGKLGVTTLEQLERPLPEGIIVVAKVALRRGDDGAEFNRLTRFEVVGVEPPTPEPFAPAAPGDAEPTQDDAAVDEAEPPQDGAPSDDGDSLDAGGFDWFKGSHEAPPAKGRGRGGKGKS